MAIGLDLARDQAELAHRWASSAWTTSIRGREGWQRRQRPACWPASTLR
jgi:hypothetical protein